MRTRTIAVILSALIVVTILGAFTIQVFSAPPRARAKAYFYPRTYTLGDPVPQPWNVWLHFSPGRTASEINASSILLEGKYSPIAVYDHPNIPRVIVSFNGFDVLEAALLKAGHMVPGGSTLVFLEVTGELMDGTPFSTGSSGVVVLFDPELPPP